MDQERVFWVLLTIFGSIFATGLFLLVEKFWWGLVEIVFGLIGMIWLIRDHFFQAIGILPIKTPIVFLVCIGVSIFVGHTISQIVATGGAVRRYVLPRTLTDKQVNGLRDYLTRRGTHAITVKVNPLDGEAIEYAAQIFRALKQTAWDVTFSTENAGPNTQNIGLSIHVAGSDVGPPDPKHDPQQLIQAAFRAADIEVNGGGSYGAGKYQLFILVGRRPLAIVRTKPILVKLGQWIMNLGQR
jgi:hypothetical protein